MSLNLTAEQVQEVNQLLEKEKLGFPEFRRTVSLSGNNQNWVYKALKNTGNGSARLRELFGLK